MEKLIIAILLLSTFLSACTNGKSIKEKSNKVESNKNNDNEKDKNEDKIDTDEILLPKEYFNVLQTVSGKQIIQNPDNDRLLVNTKYYLSSSFVPENLEIPKVTFAFSDTSVEKAHLRQTAAEALEKMFADSKSSGMNLVAVSGYRSYQRQSVLFNAEVKSKGETEAVKWVARPGTSEHQSGLAMDISSISYGSKLDQGFDQTKEFQWLSENAHKYGFILRYPKGKESITNYEYEPWHFRYVGVDVASEMFKLGISFEEFIMNARPM
ncbi:MAG: peptidase [Bacillales bacterium]|jgi:D-alanyl-D-alanine carboxypeptidase|nr:peptidase [Bacillales bacterium]